MTYGGSGIQIDDSMLAVVAYQIYDLVIIFVQAEVGRIGICQRASSVNITSNRNCAGIIGLTYIDCDIASYMALFSAAIYITGYCSTFKGN